MGLLEVVWKVIEAITDIWKKTTVKFHDILHRFHDNRRMVTAIMEINMSQELTSIYQ